MDLSPREATDLARFIARRFPERAELDRIARRARIELDDTLAGDMEVVWSTVIVEAGVQRRLRSLARVMSKDDAADPRMQEVCRLLIAMEPVPASTRVVRGLAVAGVVAAVIGLAVWGFGGQQVEPVAPQVQPVAVVEDANDAVDVAVEDPSIEVEVLPVEPVEVLTDVQLADANAAAEAAGAETAEAETAAVQADDEPVQPTETAQAAPKAASIVSSAPTNTRTGCTGAPGEVVGYWYAGDASPGRVGDTITVREAVNVRADYPDRHNGYDARSDLRCSLAVGEKVRISQAPMLVPGDRWWVPLTAGDLVSR